MRLKWDDFDLDEGTLYIRGELGKSKQERGGRWMYVSPHLIEHLKAWPKNSQWVVDKRLVSRGRPTQHNGRRMCRNRRIPRNIWERTNVPRMIWKQPFHCFRKGFNQGLFQMKVDVKKTSLQCDFQP